MPSDKDFAEEYLKKLQSIKTADDIQKVKETFTIEMKEAVLRYIKSNKKYEKVLLEEARRLWKWLE